MHRQTCVVSKYGVAGNIVPCQDETLSYINNDDFIRQTIKFFITKVVTAVNNRNKLYAIAWKYISET